MDAPRKKSKKPSATKAELLLETTTFFVDRSLGRALGNALRGVGLKVELHDSHFREDTPDEVWLVEVGRRGWVTLTKDKAIRRKAAERQAVMTAGNRVFTLPSGNMTGQEMADIYVKRRLKMARFLSKHQPPFVATVYKDGQIVLIDLEDTSREK